MEENKNDKNKKDDLTEKNINTKNNNKKKNEENINSKKVNENQNDEGKAQEIVDNIKEKTISIIKDVKDESEKYSKEEIDSGRAKAILSYIFFISLVMYLTEKENKFIIFHAKQGLNLFIWEILSGLIFSFICSVLFFMTGIISMILGIGALALTIIGIVNVVNGKAKELPIINKVKIIK